MLHYVHFLMADMLSYELKVSQYRILALATLLSGLLAFAATSPTPAPHELYGFLLEQNQTAFDGSLGKPFNEGSTPEGLAHRAYILPDTNASYLVAVFDKSRAVRLELTGTDYRGPTGFRNLTLGQDAPAIESILGKPLEIRHEADENIDLWDYTLANYSLEFTPDHKLYSIQVVEEQPRQPPGFVGSPDVRKYALAIQAADVDTLMQMSSGSLVCKHSSEFSFSRAARSDLADRTSKLMGCLTRAAEAIVSLGPKMSGADDQLRLALGPGGAFCVTKLPGTSPLKEVVFAWEVDAWRVYEVTFR